MPPTDNPLTRERILEAAEEMVRKHGPEKANVTDVARVLGVSHAAVYRHFPSKAALRAQVVEQWVHRIKPPLKAVVDDKRLSPERKLRKYFDTLFTIKRKHCVDDPELFAAFRVLAGDAKEVVVDHVADLSRMLGVIVREGVEAGKLSAKDPDAAGRALLSATTRFHHPLHAGEWDDPTLDQSFDELWELLMAGLRPR